MNGVTKEQIEQARQVGILAYMQAHEPDELVCVGTREYRTRTHDSLRISDNGKWNWCSRGVGGTNALNYLVRVEGVDFVSAVRQLCDMGAPPSVNQAVLSSRSEVHRASETPQRSDPSAVPFSAPIPDKNNNAALAYLRRRGLQTPVLSYCVDHGLLYQTNHKGHKNCVFVGKDAQGTPQSAGMRGCGGSFRGETAGGQKCFGFCIPAKDSAAQTVEVYESPIDAMSGASLRVLSGREWRSVHYLSLGGLIWQALDGFLSAHPDVRKLQLCLDNDTPGRTFAAKLVEQYTARGYTVQDLIPPRGKDANEFLQMRVRALTDRLMER